MFLNVLLKFLRYALGYENKAATREHEVNKMAQIKSALSKSQATLLEDMLGMVALIAMLLVGLYLPGTF